MTDKQEQYLYITTRARGDQPSNYELKTKKQRTSHINLLLDKQTKKKNNIQM